MSPDPISENQQALATLQSARSRVEELIATVADAAKKLLHWQDVSVANSGVSFPIGRTPSINADHWPSGQQLAEALSSWHAAQHEAGNAYRWIPEGQRGVVRPPPDD